MYTLFHDKQAKTLKIAKASVGLQGKTFTEEVVDYNGSYYFCLKRKPLTVKAQEIKQEWISELEEELRLVKNIKI